MLSGHDQAVHICIVVTPNMDPPDHYQTTYDSKTNIFVFYSLTMVRKGHPLPSPTQLNKSKLTSIRCSRTKARVLKSLKLQLKSLLHPRTCLCLCIYKTVISFIRISKNILLRQTNLLLFP